MRNILVFIVVVVCTFVIGAIKMLFKFLGAQ